MLQAQIPRQATLKCSEAKVDVTYSGEPQFKPIEGTLLSYATNTSFDVIRVGDLYYTCFQGAWFVSSTPKGPWKLTDSVPSEIYTIPPSSPSITPPTSRSIRHRRTMWCSASRQAF